jgi:hypothetical protein
VSPPDGWWWTVLGGALGTVGGVLVLGLVVEYLLLLDRLWRQDKAVLVALAMLPIYLPAGSWIGVLGPWWVIPLAVVPVTYTTLLLVLAARRLVRLLGRSTDRDVWASHPDSCKRALPPPKARIREYFARDR